jgi:hypothetical protein
MPRGRIATGTTTTAARSPRSRMSLIAGVAFPARTNT